MDDHATMIAKLGDDLSSWSINMQTYGAHSVNHLDDSGSERSIKPTGANSEPSSSGSPRSEAPTEDTMLFELEAGEDTVDEAAREAAEFVRGMLPAFGTYSDRQRCTHALATALGRSAGTATALTAHLAHTTLMRSLLRLIDDAQHKFDTLTADIVLGKPL